MMLLKLCGAHPLLRAYSAADSDSAGLRWGLDSAFLTSYPVMPVHQDHTEQQGCKELYIDMEKYLGLW